MALAQLSQPALAAAGFAAGLAMPALAALDTPLAASLDPDSYINFGTDSAFAPEITVGAHIADSNHFNFGVVTFDVTGLDAAGDKHLHLDLEVFRTTITGPTGPTGTVDLPTGNATLRLVALGDDYASYALATDKRAWYDTHLFAQDTVGTAALTEAGLFSIDVTDAVNAWIADGNTNHGFGLVVESGSPIELGATEGGNGPVLSNTAVPEPGTFALLGLAGLLVARRRRA